MVREYKADRGLSDVFLRWLRALIAWLFRIKARPGPVTKAKSKVKKVNTIEITWKDPTVREDSSALAAREIDRIEVSMRVAGAPDFTPFAVAIPGEQVAVVTDLPAGGYEFQIVAIDNQRIPQSSAPVVVSASIDVPLKAPPGAVTDAAATVK